tara:strand:- start:2349 stop:3749 length:1401 start_codon:yes stop_codon:yes gene_type:complete
MDDTPCVIWVEYDSEHDTQTIPQQFLVYTQMLSPDKKNLQGATAEAMDSKHHAHLVPAYPTIGCGQVLDRQKYKAGGPHSQHNMCMQHCKMTCLLSPDGCDFSQVGLLGGCCNMKHWKRSFGVDAEEQLDEETLGLLSCVFDLERMMFSPRNMPSAQAARELVQSIIGFDFDTRVSMAALVLLDVAKRVAMACPHANDPVVSSPSRQQGGLKLALQRMHMVKANKASRQGINTGSALAAMDPFLSSWLAATASIGPGMSFADCLGGAAGNIQGVKTTTTTPAGPGMTIAGQDAKTTTAFPVGPDVNLMSLLQPKNSSGVSAGLTTTHPVGPGMKFVPFLESNKASGVTAGLTTTHAVGLGMKFTTNQIDVTKEFTESVQFSGAILSEYRSGADMDVTASQSYQIDTLQDGDMDIWSDQSLSSPMHDEAGSGSDDILLSPDEDTMAAVRFFCMRDFACYASFVFIWR